MGKLKSGLGRMRARNRAREGHWSMFVERGITLVPIYVRADSIVAQTADEVAQELQDLMTRSKSRKPLELLMGVKSVSGHKAQRIKQLLEQRGFRVQLKRRTGQHLLIVRHKK